MSDDKKPGTAPLAVGRTSRAQAFPVVRTAEDVKADSELQAQHAGPNAMPVDAYFAIRRINNPVVRAAMLAYTKVRTASAEAFDTIFSTF